MTIHAFKDDNDGYYQCDIKDGEPFPEWTSSLIPCDVLPQPTIPNPRIAEIKDELAAIDLKSIRPAREGDTARLATLEAQAVALRAELTTL